jgi:hypothetical protein
MFENLKQAQRSGMTTRERRRFLFMLAMLLLLGGTIVGLRSCQRLPGRGELPLAIQRQDDATGRAALDRERLRGLVKDDDAARLTFQEAVIEHVRSLQAIGIAEPPQPTELGELASRDFADAVGRHVEVEGRVTAIVHMDYRSDLETLWALVLEGTGGGQVLAVRIGSTREPGSGAPTDAWPLAPVELQVGDRALVRGVVVQRRQGTVGEIALGEPTPTLLCSHFRRQLDPPADPIEDLSEAAFDKVDDRFFAGTARLDDPVIYEVLQWLQLKGHAWARAQIDSGALKVEEFGREEFDLWGEEAGVLSAEQPRPFTEKSRGKVFRTSGLVGKVLLDDWASIRPNRWGVNQLRHVYLWSDYYGNSVVPCLSPYPWETFGVEDWRSIEQRVWIYGVFVKNHTYDRQQGSREGGHMKLTMPLFIVLDVRPYPMNRGGGSGAVALVLLGMLILGTITWVVLQRNERRESEALRERQARWRQAQAPRGASGGAPPPETPSS